MEQLIPSLVFYLLVPTLCLLRPAAGRIFVGVFFLIMAFGVNLALVFLAPEQFVGLGANEPLLPLYEWFFENVVALAPSLLGLLAAAYEAAVGLTMLSKGRTVTWGLVGGIVFLLTITPLGVWTLANPVLAVALASLLRRRYDKNVLELLRSRFLPRPPRVI